LAVDFIPQFSGTFEGHYPSFSQQQVFACGWITSPAGLFVSHTKFSKTGNQYIIAVGQR
jgi:hypothetical protein